ncbi:hypothetical protein GCM10023208_26970 [Erythrobacter westpacificensis]|uniref:Peptidase S24/S26A/S26B/S26C domain-containing protein n=1 Tax=Erythrobacter westpacificensis TaxID=1055231 RepID=A0ABP9KLR3_9SPHN
MDPREKLADLAKERGTSLASLSRMLSRNPTYLQQYITKGSPKKLEEEDRGILAQFFGVEESELGGPKDKSYERRDDDKWVEAPRLEVDASAGPGAADAQDRVFDAFRFSKRWLTEQGLEGAKLSAIRVVGDSMEPLLREGDEVLVDRRDQPFRDGVHVVRLDESLLVKRVASKGGGRFSLLSQNLAYPPIDVSADEFAIIGRVVWKSGRV